MNATAEDFSGRRACRRVRLAAAIAFLTLCACDATPRRASSGLPASIRAQIEALRPKAQAGDADAQFDIAMRLHDKGASIGDRREALFWLEKSTGQRHWRSQSYLGLMYTWGLYGVSVDCARGLPLIRAGARTNDGNALYIVGLAYYDGQCIQQDYAQADKWFRRAVRNNSSNAETYLGLMYQNGRGVRRDHAKAVYWFKRAAAQNNAWAINNLGACYHNGTGVDRNIPRTLELYDRAAKLGNEVAAKNARQLRWRLLEQMIEAE